MEVVLWYVPCSQHELVQSHLFVCVCVCGHPVHDRLAVSSTRLSLLAFLSVSNALQYLPELGKRHFDTTAVVVKSIANHLADVCVCED